MQLRPVITLHWFHHASVIGFAWSAWIYETPAALWYGAMNYSVHAIMYTYFALTAVPQYRASVLKVAPIITGLQISQFAWGTVINAIAAVAYAQPDVGCAIQPAILYLAAGLYLAYGALFVHLFVRRYVRKEKEARGRGAGERGRQRHEQRVPQRQEWRWRRPEGRVVVGGLEGVSICVGLEPALFVTPERRNLRA